MMSFLFDHVHETQLSAFVKLSKRIQTHSGDKFGEIASHCGWMKHRAHSDAAGLRFTLTWVVENDSSKFSELIQIRSRRANRHSGFAMNPAAKACRSLGFSIARWFMSCMSTISKKWCCLSVFSSCIDQCWRWSSDLQLLNPRREDSSLNF
jgi:hypothetical protein